MRVLDSRKLGEDIDKRKIFNHPEGDDIFIRWYKWKQILMTSTEDQVLADLIEKAEVIYELSRQHTI